MHTHAPTPRARARPPRSCPSRSACTAHARTHSLTRPPHAPPAPQVLSIQERVDALTAEELMSPMGLERLSSFVASSSNIQHPGKPPDGGAGQCWQ